MARNLLLLFAGLSSVSYTAIAQNYTFSPMMVDGVGDSVDISLFNQGVQPPGKYSVSVILNGTQVDNREITFILKKDDEEHPYLFPCLTIEQLSSYGVRTEDYPALTGDNGFASITAIPQAAFDFRFSSQELHLSIPQVSMRPEEKGIAPQALWDDGIPAFLMNYSASSSRSEYHAGYGGKQRSASTFIQLSPGLNLGSWRLRNQSNWQKQSSAKGKWQTLNSYAQRGLPSVKSRLTLGEYSTPGDIFTSVPFRGGQIASDDNMVPYNQRAFSPVVRGIARTQARVEVKQNGYVLYNNIVAPGPFALTDLSTSGASGGDFQVTVWETDGSPQVFTVAYQTPAIALKEGRLNYSVMAGQYRPSDTSVQDATLAQATLMYGLPWNLTAYAGTQGAAHFQSGSLGLGVSAGNWGAVSADVTASRGELQGNASPEKGSAWRVRYSKDVVATHTTIAMSSYQYASSGYNTMTEVLDSWRDRPRYEGSDHRERIRSETSLTLNQSLGDRGNISLAGSRRDYRNRPGYNNSFSASYGVGLFSGASLSLSWSDNRQTSGHGRQSRNRITSLWLSVPLERLIGANAWATYRATSAGKGRNTHQLGLRGTAFEQRLNWDFSQHYAPGQAGDNDYSSASLNWNGAHGQVGGNYSHSSGSRQAGVDFSGGVIVHRGGITLGQTLGETVALIDAPGATDVSVTGGSAGIRTDYRGYATQNWVTPYQENTVSLDPLSMPPDVEISQTDVKVVPTQGAVVAAKFNTRTGGRALVTLTKPDGGVVPFGAMVTLQDQEGTAGIVGSDGQVYLSGLPAKGQLIVSWSGHQYRVKYQLPEKTGSSGVYSFDGQCR